MPDWLWLDDERPAPGPGWEHAYTADEAIRWMADNGTPEVTSLDHDLAEDQYPWEGKEYGQYEDLCGFDVVKWMMAASVFPAKVIIHTMNPVGAANMIQELQRYRYFCTGFARVPLANPYSHVMERDD